MFSSVSQKYSCHLFSATVTSVHMTQGASDAQMRGGCLRGSCSSPASSPKYGCPSFYFWVCRGSAWRGSTCHPFSPYMICGGMFEPSPTPTPSPSLSQTRLLSVGWVCWSVIGWVLNIIPQALMLNITHQSCKPSAVGQMLLCKDSQTCITRPPATHPVDSLAFWVLWCQSWRLLHFFSPVSDGEERQQQRTWQIVVDILLLEYQ